MNRNLTTIECVFPRQAWATHREGIFGFGKIFSGNSACGGFLPVGGKEANCSFRVFRNGHTWGIMLFASDKRLKPKARAAQPMACPKQGETATKLFRTFPKCGLRPSLPRLRSRSHSGRWLCFVGVLQRGESMVIVHKEDWAL